MRSPTKWAFSMLLCLVARVQFIRSAPAAKSFNFDSIKKHLEYVTSPSTSIGDLRVALEGYFNAEGDKDREKREASYESEPNNAAEARALTDYFYTILNDAASEEDDRSDKLVSRDRRDVGELFQNSLKYVSIPNNILELVHSIFNFLMQLEGAIKHSSLKLDEYNYEGPRGKRDMDAVDEKAVLPRSRRDVIDMFQDILRRVTIPKAILEVVNSIKQFLLVFQKILTPYDSKPADVYGGLDYDYDYGRKKRFAGDDDESPGILRSLLTLPKEVLRTLFDGTAAVIRNLFDLSEDDNFEKQDYVEDALFDEQNRFLKSSSEEIMGKEKRNADPAL